MEKKEKNRLTYSCFSFGVLLIYFLICFYKYSAPGLYYDELFWINASLGDINGDFIALKIGKIPVLLMDYIGALKAYVYAVPFALFGTSTAVLRITEIILGEVALLLSMLFVKKFSDEKTSVLTGVLLVLDSSFVYTTKLDWGPVSIMLICKALSFVFLKLYFERHQIRYLLLVGVSLLLGLFDKANFSWNFVAFFVSAFVVYGRELLNLFQKNKKTCLAYLSLATTTAIVGFKWLIPLFKNDNANTGASIFTHLTQEMHYCWDAFVGNGPYGVFFEGELKYKSIFGFFVILAAILGTIISIYNIKKKKRIDESRFFIFCILNVIVVFMCIVLTKSSSGIHHIMSLWPMPEVIVVCTGKLIFDMVEKEKGRKAMGVLLFGLFFVLCVTMLRNLLEYKNAIDNSQERPTWSTAIYQLAEYLENENPDYIMCADWGFGTQLLLLLEEENKSKIYDYWPLYSNADFSTMKWLNDEFIDGKKTVILMHTKGKESAVKSEQVYYSVDMFLPYERIDAICDETGQEIYQIIVFDKR